MIEKGSVIKITATEAELLEIGINPVTLTKRYPKGYAIVTSIFQSPPDRTCYELHRGFNLTSTMIKEDLDVNIYVGKNLDMLLDTVLKDMKVTKLDKRLEQMDISLEKQTDRIKKETRLKLKKLEEDSQ